MDELPDECEEQDPCQEDAEENAFVPVFSTHNPTDVATVQWLLGDAGIRHYFSGEHAARAKHPALSAILLVERDRVEDAIKLLKEFQSTWAGFSGFSA